MSSNIEIKKKCKWCGQIFIAQERLQTIVLIGATMQPIKNVFVKSA